MRKGRQVETPYLDSPNIGVLRNILILIESIFGRLAFLQIDAEFDKQYHYRLKGSDRTVPGSLGCDMFVEER